MADSPKSSAGETPRAGKVRTWWHPLLVRLLRYGMGDGYDIEEEVSVGEQPLRVDVVLIRRKEGQVSDQARRIFPELVDLLADYTYLEFKGPTDALQRGDLEKTLGVVHLHRSEHTRDVEPQRVGVIFVVPRLNAPFQTDVKTLNLSVTTTAPGCHRIDGGLFPTWCLETGVESGARHPGLTLFSPTLLKARQPMIQELTNAGMSDILNYVVQQIRQFQIRLSDFALHHSETELMVKLSDDVKKSFLESLAPEERIEGLSMGKLSEDVRRSFLQSLDADEKKSFLESLASEERIDGLSVEERIDGLSVEELKRALPPEVRRQLSDDETSESGVS